MLDELKKHPYISEDITITEHNKPFRYYVLNNVFKKEIYDIITQDCLDSTKDTAAYGSLENATSNYGGRIQNIGRENIKKGVDFFVNSIWKSFNANFFDITLTKYQALSFHVHDAPSKPGFIHSDFNICSFDNLGNEDYELINCPKYADDGDDQYVKVMRSVAFLYYFNNNKILSLSGDGGTNVYDNNDQLIDTVNCANNSLLCFEVTPETYHAFTGSTFPRHAVVGWFHSNPAGAVFRNLPKVRNMYYENGKTYITEKWPNETYWPITRDIYYEAIFTGLSSAVAKEFNLPFKRSDSSIFSDKNILIIGGTQMFGRAFIELTLANDEFKFVNITVANRGVTDPKFVENNPRLDFIRIDRDSEECCEGFLQKPVTWDYVLDFSCYNVKQFVNVEKFLAYKKYVYISTTGAKVGYYPEGHPYKEYGDNKRAVEEHISKMINSDDIIIFRSPAIYGPHEYTGRYEEKNGSWYRKEDNYCVSDDDSGEYKHVYDVVSSIQNMLEMV